MSLTSISTETTTSSTVYPLTTLFTPGPNCALNGFDAGSDISIPTTSPNFTIVNYMETCAPVVYPTGSASSMQYQKVSPGVCPLGWTPGPTATSASQTSVICCPVGTVPDRNAVFCNATFTTPVAFFTNIDSSGQVTVPSGNLLNPFFMTVTWEEKDLVSFTPASAPLMMKSGEAFTIPESSTSTTASSSSSTKTRPSATSRSSTPSQAQPTTESVNPTNTPPGGLSIGAQAGIGVGAAAGGLLLLGAAAFATIRRRRSKRVQVKQSNKIQSSEVGGFQSQPEMMSR